MTPEWVSVTEQDNLILEKGALIIWPTLSRSSHMLVLPDTKITSNFVRDA